MAYTATVSSPMKHAERISHNLGIYAGKVDVASYHATLIKITGITDYFVTGGVSGFTAGLIAVIPTGISENGYGAEWIYDDGAFKCYKPSAATTLGVSVISSGAAIPIYFASAAGTLVSSSAAGTGTYALPIVAAAASEAATNDDIGEIGFIAIGFIR